MDSGDFSWMLISTALVVFMIPGLALFYGGLVYWHLKVSEGVSTARAVGMGTMQGYRQT